MIKNSRYCFLSTEYRVDVDLLVNQNYVFNRDEVIKCLIAAVVNCF